MSKRIHLRSQYVEGWYEMDVNKLLSSTTEGFIFDDPAEPEPVTKKGLADYMARWDRRTRAAGASNQWVLTDQVRQDADGVLTDWEWWELVGTELCGSGLIKTCDDGVFLERITYFDRRHR